MLEESATTRLADRRDRTCQQPPSTVPDVLTPRLASCIPHRIDLQRLGGSSLSSDLSPDASDPRYGPVRLSRPSLCPPTSCSGFRSLYCLVHSERRLRNRSASSTGSRASRTSGNPASPVLEVLRERI